jgi:hypothetical protein
MRMGYTDQLTAKSKLTPDKIERHFTAQKRSLTLGLHAASPDNLSKWP